MVIGREDEMLAEALEFLSAHVSRGIDINALLDHLGVSRRTLEYRFREHLRTTPHAYLRRLRSREACRLLDETDLSITEIAYRSGYASLERFTVAFGKETGMTATQYRRRRLMART